MSNRIKTYKVVSIKLAAPPVYHESVEGKAGLLPSEVAGAIRELRAKHPEDYIFVFSRDPAGKEEQVGTIQPNDDFDNTDTLARRKACDDALGYAKRLFAELDFISVEIDDPTSYLFDDKFPAVALRGADTFPKLTLNGTIELSPVPQWRSLGRRTIKWYVDANDVDPGDEEHEFLDLGKALTYAAQQVLERELHYRIQFEPLYEQTQQPTPTQED